MSVICQAAIRLVQVHGLLHMIYCSGIEVMMIHRQGLWAWDPAFSSVHVCSHTAAVQSRTSSLLRLSGQQIYLRLYFLSSFFSQVDGTSQNSPEQPLVNGRDLKKCACSDIRVHFKN